MPKTFQVSDEQQQKIDEWLRDTVYPQVVAVQRGETQDPSPIQEDCWAINVPYMGAIGGGLSYEFSSTSLGVVLIVKFPGDYELNVTDYDSW